ncbi:tripartite tricarboxylate transporter TctB family protein [Pseudooceanicola sp.]|uniref:tripartite tricarboxylate transporter TctB family protein n=1 Tax=Pseudooceanicola sp. TaxID=1914328 RepID=UPI00262CC939|nr:tripartite tricarboxylate transporter TctB family protein [Pseudooceanicola sp.]MDF1855922.1 tripartite tricarboxylate transporter TctB family protein [Pseudooceanicola sp.]
MLRFDLKDFIGGFILFAIGLTAAGYAATEYSLGSLRRMGPGMFPVGIAGILAGLGLVVMVQSLFRPPERADIRIWSPLFVLSSIAIFALTIPHFGLIPAIIGITVVSSMAELKVRPANLALLCLALSLLTPFVFRVCLGLQIAMFDWPF